MKQPAPRTLWQDIVSAVTNKNSLGENLRGIPLFNRGYGKRLDTGADFTLEDKDLYVGYLFSAIKVRANRTAGLATESIITKWKDEEREEDHPYLAVIDSSPTFSNFFFWQALSTFLDLRGKAYLMAIRNVNGNRVGDIQELKILNPANIRKVYRKGNMEFGGYIETKGSMQREIPKEMMIEVLSLNPFNLTDGFSIAEAAKDDQALSQQAATYTRKSIANNVGQRGLLVTDVLLEDSDFENFKTAVEQTGLDAAGKFLYGNGPGAITYTDMQIDLEKLALSAINEISREKLFAAAGVSKSILGIEQSGVTRETSRAQSDLFLQNQIIPQLQTIIDALNQDYRNYYKTEFEANRAEFVIDSPLKVDREAELKDAEINKVKAETVSLLVKTGFTPAEVLEQVGLPEMTFEPQSFDPVDASAVTQEHAHEVESKIDMNAIDDKLRAVIVSKQSSLENDIQNIQRRLVQSALKKMDTNALTEDEEAQVISKKDKKEAEQELTLALSVFMSSMIPLFATQTLKERFKQFALPGSFSMNAEVRLIIRKHSKLVATGHVETVLDEIYKVAREAAEDGLSRAQILGRIKDKFNNTISKTQATRIARTETNNAVAQAQYQADKQFVKQNNLQGRVYKRWVTRSQAPCAFCKELESQTAANPIPFSDNFVNLGESVNVDVETKEGTESKSFVAGYESVGAGTLHANCVLPDTEILASGTKRIIRSYYSGETVKLTLPNSRSLTVTPNHIILTNRGFVAAKNISEGDDVVDSSALQRVILSNPDTNLAPAKISDVFSALVESGSVEVASVPVTAKDLHGDAGLGDGNIDVISTDGLLPDTLKPTVRELVEQSLLNTAKFALPLDVESDLLSVLIALSLASDGGVSSLDTLEAVLRRSLSQEEMVSLLNPTRYDARLKQAASNDVSGDSESIRNVLLRLTGLVTMQSVLKVERSTYSGHVYDLDTIPTLYTANGVISSNCSCIYELIIR